MPELPHKRADFADLLRIVAERESITPTLVAKDHWIMHYLWGLKNDPGECTNVQPVQGVESAP